MRDHNDEWDVTQPRGQFCTLGKCKTCNEFTRVYIAADFIPDQRGYICAECLKPHGWVYDLETLELVKMEVGEDGGNTAGNEHIPKAD